MVAASILPITMHNNQLHFLFGKENSMEDSAKGWSDFGGRVDHGESIFQGALREGSEELTGFLGDEKALKSMIRKNGGFHKMTHNKYNVHAFYLPYDEKHNTSPVNPYGRTKLMVENILNDWSYLDNKRRASVLRYFNPVGAHPSTLIGEDPSGIPNNLMPYITQVAIGKRDYLNIYGNDYETHDGTGIRDYIHVVDLAKAHVATIEKQHVLYPFEVINIGSGEGTSVLELVKAFELASGIKINLIISDRRDGDLAETWTNPDFAFNKIGWKAKLNINDMCRDSWAWQKNNPKGYT